MVQERAAPNLQPFFYSTGAQQGVVGIEPVLEAFLVITAGKVLVPSSG